MRTSSIERTNYVLSKTLKGLVTDTGPQRLFSASLADERLFAANDLLTHS
jgi:hypothetical protein